MNGKFYIFVSMPMNGKDKKEIESRNLSVKTFVYAMISLVNNDVDTRKINIISTFEKDIPKNFPEFEIDDRKRVYCLGDSISKMYQADLVIFGNGWASASGCQVEHCVCANYHIPNIDIYGYDEDEDNESIYTIANWFNQLYLDAIKEDAP